MRANNSVELLTRLLKMDEMVDSYCNSLLNKSYTMQIIWILKQIT